VARLCGATSLLTTSLCLALSASLALPDIAFAAPPASDDSAMAQTLYQEGEALFKTADYDGALEKWRAAYGLLPATADTQAIRNSLAFNIAEAERRAYAIDQDVAHLRKAKILLEDYIAENERLYGNEARAAQERSDAKERLAAIDAEIAAAAQGPSSPGGATPPPQSGGIALSPEEQRIQEIKASPDLQRQWNKSKGLIIGGSITLGLGGPVTLAGLGTMIAGATADAFDPIDGSETRADNAAIAAGGVITVVGLGMMAGGAAMLGIGIKRRRELKQPRTAVTAAPYGDRTGAGVVVHMRF
jgi:hypothetical protein